VVHPSSPLYAPTQIHMCTYTCNIVLIIMYVAVIIRLETKQLDLLQLYIAVLCMLEDVDVISIFLMFSLELLYYANLILNQNRGKTKRMLFKFVEYLMFS
jgi:hypothetical protein